MDYLDFELEIQAGTGLDYPVAVLRSPAGEARATMQFPFDQLALESRLDKLQIALLRSGGKRRSAQLPEVQQVQQFGQALFDALITGEVRSCYDVSRERAAQDEQGLRLKLRIEDPRLAALPWEYLYDARQADYVCLSRDTPIVRYLELPQRIQSLAIALPLRILGMIASPSDLDALDVSQEKMRVEQAVAGLSARGLVVVSWLAGHTWRDLLREMQGGPWHIFHFIGHGGFDENRDEGFICLAGEDGCRHDLYATDLGRLLHDHHSLRLVLLNACEGARGGQQIFSSTASVLVRRGMPAVLAMQYQITDQAAVEFVRALYESLAGGLPVDAAVSEARKAVSLGVANTLEWGTPVLHMRSPDGVLFDVTERRASSGPPARPQDVMMSPPPEEPLPAARPSAPPEVQPPAVKVSPPDEAGPDRRLLRTVLAERFSDEDLRSLCFDLDIDYESLPGEGKAGKARELVTWCQRRGRLAELAGTVQSQRQGVNLWSAPFPAPAVELPRSAAVPDLPDSEVTVPPSGSGPTRSAQPTATTPQAALPPVAGERLPDTGTSQAAEAMLGRGWGPAGPSAGNAVPCAAEPPVARGATPVEPSPQPRVSRAADLPPAGRATLEPSPPAAESDAALPGVSPARRPERPVTPLAAMTGHDEQVNAVAFSPDCRWLASGAGSWSARTVPLLFWEAATGQRLAALSGHTGSVSSLAFSPDSRLLASASDDLTVRLWDVDSRRLLYTLEGHTGGVLSVAFSPDGSLLASGAADNTVRVWDVATQRLCRELPGHPGGALSAVFLPDGGLATAAADGTIRIWTSGLRLVYTLGGQTARVDSAAFSPDGRLLAFGSSDQLIRVWSVAAQRQLATLPSCHAGPVWTVTFSPHGHRLASGCKDNTIRLWDVSSQRLLQTVAGHTGGVLAAAFSLNGRLLASGSYDQTVRLWNLGR